MLVMCSIHITVEEKLVLTAGRDGGLQNMEVHGLMKLRLSDDRVGRIKLCAVNNDTKGIQIQVTALMLRILFDCVLIQDI